MSMQVDELLRAYAACATYRDDGTSLWVVRDAESKIEASARFTTAFVRSPFRFRFFLEETAGSILIHATEAEVRVVSSNRPLERHRTLREAIKPTFGCAHGVLTLAVPLLLAWNETIFGRERRLDFEKAGHDIAIALDRRGAIASVTTAWTGAAVIGGPTAIDQRTTFRAELGVPIGDDELRFEAGIAESRRRLN